MEYSFLRKINFLQKFRFRYILRLFRHVIYGNIVLKPYSAVAGFKILWFQKKTLCNLVYRLELTITATPHWFLNKYLLELKWLYCNFLETERLKIFLLNLKFFLMHHKDVREITSSTDILRVDDPVVQKLRLRQLISWFSSTLYVQ